MYPQIKFVHAKYIVFLSEKSQCGRIKEEKVKYSLLTFSEPQTGFHIAFNMFDTDGNQRVDKNEFLVVSTNHGLQH